MVVLAISLSQPFHVWFDCSSLLYIPTLQTIILLWFIYRNKTPTSIGIQTRLIWWHWFFVDIIDFENTSWDPIFNGILTIYTCRYLRYFCVQDVFAPCSVHTTAPESLNISLPCWLWACWKFKRKNKTSVVILILSTQKSKVSSIVERKKWTGSSEGWRINQAVPAAIQSHLSHKLSPYFQHNIGLVINLLPYRIHEVIQWELFFQRQHCTTIAQLHLLCCVVC